MNSQCEHYKEYSSLRKTTFFEGLRLPLITIMKIIIQYASRIPRFSITAYSIICKKTILKIIERIIQRIPAPDFSENKLGGFNRNVQIDETMLNYKCKNHRGRSPTNKTDALCIIEMQGLIIRVFAKMIPNKKAETLITLICQQVAANSIIWKDEHRSHSKLSQFNYIHDTVCHKYQFINQDTGTNTQFVEFFNNYLKLNIKMRKEINKFERGKFLKEMCFRFNNKNNLLLKIMDLLKL